MACEECRELSTHAFRSGDDLLHALRLAGEEMERGVLSRVATETRTSTEQEALDSSLFSGALPARVLYRFECRLCGDRFVLEADTRTGEGGWTRDSA